MALEITGHKRVFKFKKDGKDIELPDPNPNFSLADVQKFYSGEFPEMTNATLAGPKVVGDKAEYKLTTVVGTKG